MKLLTFAEKYRRLLSFFERKVSDENLIYLFTQIQKIEFTEEDFDNVCDEIILNHPYNNSNFFALICTKLKVIEDERKPKGKNAQQQWIEICLKNQGEI